MPVTSSAKRALRKDRRRTIINKRLKKRIRQALKEARKKPTAKTCALATSILDRATKKKVIHKNKAARLKSRLAKLQAEPRFKPQNFPAKSIGKVVKRI